jgi:hypothetical protein
VQSAGVLAVGFGGLLAESGGLGDRFGEILRDALTAYY